MRTRKRLLSLLLCGAMLFFLCSPSAFAKEQTTQDSGQITADAGGLCEHHTEHTPDCGYTEEGELGTPCGFICEICGAEDASLSDTAAITADQALGNVFKDKTSDHERTEDLVGVWSDKEPFLMEAEEEDDLSGQLFGITRASNICPTYDEAYNAMIGMKDEFYEGMPWTNFQPYGNEGERGKYYRFQGGPVKGASLGVGCAAFVFLLSDEAFGDLPARTIDKGGFKYEDVKVGDILRINNSHFVIVLRVASGGVTVAEGNYNKSVHWGRTLSKSEVLNANFIVTRYPSGYSEDQDADEVAYSGTEGSLLSWTLTKGGTLTISGKGAMPDYTESVRPTWEDYYADKINQVIIEDGVESIGSYAFYQSQAMSVQIPETVTSIKEAAFGESKLMEITVPGSVKEIGDEAFYNCQSLKSATFYEGVQSIGVNAFHKCGISYLDFPASITSVGAGAFMECNSLVRVRFAPGEQTVSLGDNLFSKCWYLSDVTLPLKADKISSGMFTNCMALNYLYIPAGVEVDGTGSVGSPFAGCTLLKTIDFGGTESEWNANGGPPALNYAGLIGKVTVNFNAAFDDPFGEIPGDPGEFVPCEHVDKDGDGRCDICDAVLSTKPGDPEGPGDGGDTSGGNSGGSSGGWDDSSTPAYGSDTFSNGGVTLSGSGIHKNARLTVTPNNLHDGKCAECDQIRQWQEQGRVIAIYDVSLSYGFRGTVTLTFPVSSEYNGKTLTVAHCLKDKLESHDVVVSNGKIKVTVDSLSPFAILDNSKDESGKDNPDTGTIWTNQTGKKSPLTGDNCTAGTADAEVQETPQIWRTCPVRKS
ncbi:leucine-rich repeat domain-containing protein [Lachnospiraceae bacterium 29-91]